MNITESRSRGCLTTLVRLDRGAESERVADFDYGGAATVTVEDKPSSWL